MKKGTPFIVLCLILASAIFSCKKDIVDLTDPIPVILGITVSPGTVVEFQDSILFVVEYRDGDGDLGENLPDVHNLFIQDNRINIVEEYRIRELAPSGAEIPITGKLNVVLNQTGITDGSNSQSATFTIWLRDRAGNESEKVMTENIQIVR